MKLLVVHVSLLAILSLWYSTTHNSSGILWLWHLRRLDVTVDYAFSSPPLPVPSSHLPHCSHHPQHIVPLYGQAAVGQVRGCHHHHHLIALLGRMGRAGLPLPLLFLRQ